MWPIIVRLIPYVLLVFLSVKCGLSAYRSYKKRRNTDRRKSKNEAIICLLIGIFACCLTGYKSLDLICKDPITQQGIYIGHHNKSCHVFSVDGKEEHCYVLPGMTKHLEEGEQYEFTYAKRTHALLSIEEMNSKNVDTINDAGDVSMKI